MASCTEIEYKELAIVYTDMEGTGPEESIGLFDENHKIISTKPPNSVYSLVNAKDARFNSRLIQKIKETVKKNNPYSKATAVAGLNTLTKLMVNSIISLQADK